jgi:hypothetical protein
MTGARHCALSAAAVDAARPEAAANRPYAAFAGFGALDLDGRRLRVFGGRGGVAMCGW